MLTDEDKLTGRKFPTIRGSSISVQSASTLGRSGTFCYARQVKLASIKQPVKD